MSEKVQALQDLKRHKCRLVPKHQIKSHCTDTAFGSVCHFCGRIALSETMDIFQGSRLKVCVCVCVCSSSPFAEKRRLLLYATADMLTVTLLLPTATLQDGGSMNTAHQQW